LFVLIYSDEVESGETIECPNKHTMCLECFRTGVTLKLSQGMISNKCTGGCDEEYDEVYIVKNI
jgi:hypothetical protein